MQALKYDFNVDLRLTRFDFSIEIRFSLTDSLSSIVSGVSMRTTSGRSLIFGGPSICVCA